MGEALGAMGINGPFLISQIVNFLILFGLLTVLLWKPARKRLEEREQTLKQQAADAEAAAQRLEQVDQEREAVLEKARKEADKIVAQAQERVEAIKADAEAEAKEIIQQAREEAVEEKNEQLKGVRDQVGVLAIAATQKLLGAALDESRQKKLVDEFFSSVKEGKVVVLEGVDLAGRKAVVTSALPLTDQEKKVIEDDILKRTKEDTEVTFKVDPDLLGGLTIRIGDTLYDYSVSSQLAEMGSRLT